MAAKLSKLDKLHEKVTQLFIDMLEDAEAVMLPPATLKTITSFLKDNDVTCDRDDASIDTLQTRLAKKTKTHISLASVTHLDEREVM